MDLFRQYMMPRALLNILEIFDKLETTKIETFDKVRTVECEAEHRLAEALMEAEDQTHDKANENAVFEPSTTNAGVAGHPADTHIAELHRVRDSLRTRMMKLVLARDTSRLAGVYGGFFVNAILENGNENQEELLASIDRMKEAFHAQHTDALLAINEHMSQADDEYEVHFTGAETIHFDQVDGIFSSTGARSDTHKSHHEVDSSAATLLGVQNTTTSEALTLSQPFTSSSYFTLGLILAFFLGMAFHHVYKKFLHTRLIAVAKASIYNVPNAAKTICMSTSHIVKTITSKTSCFLEQIAGTISYRLRCPEAHVGWAERRKTISCTLVFTSVIAIQAVSSSLARIALSKPFYRPFDIAIYVSLSGCSTNPVCPGLVVDLFAVTCLVFMAFGMISETKPELCLDGRTDFSLESAHKCAKCAWATHKCVYHYVGLVWAACAVLLFEPQNERIWIALALSLFYLCIFAISDDQYLTLMLKEEDQKRSRPQEQLQESVLHADSSSASNTVVEELRSDRADTATDATTQLSSTHLGKEDWEVLE